MPLLLCGCTEFLREEVYTQYEPDAFLADPAGVDALLVGAYSEFIYTAFAETNHFILAQLPTDETWETGGGLNRQALPFIEFTWDASDGYFNGHYNSRYSAIAAANNVLAVVETVEGLDPATGIRIQAESRFLRAYSYYILHDFFGPTPIITVPPGASLDEVEAIGKETARATEEEYRAYVEADLQFAAENLSYGGLSSRANRGSSLALLAKFYLDNKQWQEAADAAGRVIDEGSYELYEDYQELFSVEGENNNEYIFRFECQVGSSQQNVYMPYAFPPNYPIESNWENFGAQFRTYTAFYETFEEGDLRTEIYITEYTPTTTGELTPLLRDSDGAPLDDVRNFKYKPDPNANGRFSGNDYPLIRLADILLTRAEALNEVSGPNQESIDLINRVRSRAGVAPLSLGDYGTTAALREFLLAERGRELTSEDKRRTDLIRHGKFIEQAIARGKPAKPYHVLYPLPQSQLDNNPNLRQNDGY